MERIGTTVSGRPALLTPLAAQWWRLWAAAVAHDLPGTPLRITQALGQARASAGTHSDGWCVDLSVWGMTVAQINALVAHARNHGAPATWYRPHVGDFPHIHLVVNAGRHTASSYQTAAVAKRRDGLGRAGLTGPDPHPAPTRWLTASQAITIMKEQTDMPLTADDLRAIRKEVHNEINNNPTISVVSDRAGQAATAAELAASRVRDINRDGPRSLRQEVADCLTILQALAPRIEKLEAAVTKLQQDRQ